MGFIINADLETSQGPTQELYVRVEGFSFNKVTAQLGFQVTYWIDREHAIRHNRVYLEEEVRPMEGLVQNKIMYYDSPSSDGKELELSQYIKSEVAEQREVDIPEYGEEDVIEKVPYVSFDENGDEVIKYREVIKQKTVLKGTKKEKRTVIDLKAFDNLYEYCYKRLYEYLSRFIAEEKIETVK